MTVMIVDDEVSEGEEQFQSRLQLLTTDANVIINPAVTTILILDDDSMYCS